MHNPIKLGVCFLLTIFLAACAVKPPHRDTFSFAVTGDTPYNETEEQNMEWMLDDMNKLDLAFVVHVGDFKSGGDSSCSDALFAKRKMQFNKSAHPFIYTPGDNDWTDCRRESNGAFDPLERLKKLREVFFSSAYSLGARQLPLTQQNSCVLRIEDECKCPALPENARWENNGIVFTTLNIPGSNNNSGFDAASDYEYRCRSLANKIWLDQLLDAADKDSIHGAVVFIQANPWEKSRDGAYDAFLKQISAGAIKLRKPLLFVHGDTHTYRFDKPFVTQAGETINNLTRLETYGSPLTGWVKVTVDQNDPALFRIESGGKY